MIVPRLLSFLGLSASLLLAQEQPNIVFLFSDDQNLNSVGVYGNPEVVTPHMDQLGNDGVIFDRHYNTTAICMASRANVMTGMYEYKTGTNFEHGNMTPGIWAKSYSVLLRENGYYTAFAGKFGFEIDGYGYDASSFFDKWGGGSGQTSYNTANNQNNISEYAALYPHSTLAYGAFGQDAIREAVAEEKPFCLSISFKAPHRPESPDPQFNHIYEDYKNGSATFTRPVNYGREFSLHMSPQSKTGRQWDRWDNWGNGPQYATDYDLVMATYYQQVYGIDVALGMVRQTLQDEGVADNTIVVFTSDNGFMTGAHGYGSKVLPMEESSRVPLLIYDPRSNSAGQGQRCDALTGNIDFAPYFLELAGLPIPENMDGKSLAPLLEDPTQDIRDQLALMNVWGPLSTHCLSVVTQAEKYTYWFYSDATMQPFEEMYDLANDPYEFVNIANADHADLLEEMRGRYDAELQNWVAEAVSYNNYEIYGTHFERVSEVIPGPSAITWGVPTNVSSTTDVSTNGELVTALNAAGDGAAGVIHTVNGVDFVSASIFGLSFDGDRYEANNTGDAAYDALLGDIDYGDETSFSVAGLTPGYEYEIQIWYMDDRSNAANFTMVLSDPVDPTNSVSINDQYVIGTFFADGESKTIDVSPSGPSRAHLTAYQVREIGSPSNFFLWSTTRAVAVEAEGDHNNNGIPNLIEFAIGGESIPERQSDQTLTLTVAREAIEDGTTVELEYSVDLQNWTTATETTSGTQLLETTVEENGDETRIFDLQSPAATDLALFWRLVAY